MTKNNKKFLKLTLAALTSLCVLTGCHSDDKTKSEPDSKVKTETEAITETIPEIDEKAKESTASQDVMDAIPEGTPIMGPPVDADGNLPEEFQADDYYSGYVEE